VNFLTFTFYKNALNLNTFGLPVHTQIVTCDLLHYLILYRNNDVAELQCSVLVNTWWIAFAQCSKTR